MRDTPAHDLGTTVKAEGSVCESAVLAAVCRSAYIPRWVVAARSHLAGDRPVTFKRANASADRVAFWRKRDTPSSNADPIDPHESDSASRRSSAIATGS